jgi:hypothetical protein
VEIGVAASGGYNRLAYQCMYFRRDEQMEQDRASDVSFITQNWRGQPLVSHETVVNLIGNTTTTTGLRIKAKLNRKKYQLGVKVSNAELSKVNLKPAKFHGDWNYTVTPNAP